MLDPLFFGSNDVTGDDGQYGTVHGHGHRHLVQGYPAKQDLHIFHGIDGHTGLADIAHHPGVIRVISPVGRQIKGHGKPFLTGRQVAPVKRIGLSGR